MFTVLGVQVSVWEVREMNLGVKKSDKAVRLPLACFNLFKILLERVCPSEHVLLHMIPVSLSKFHFLTSYVPHNVQANRTLFFSSFHKLSTGVAAGKF